MEQTQQIKLLQMTYAGVLADVVMQYDKEGILESVIARKRRQQPATGAMMVKQFGISKPEEVFTRLMEVFACACWKIIPNDDGFTAESSSCMLCGIAKKIQGASPCALYCLNPMEAMVKAVAPGSTFEVGETLWDGQKCRVHVKSTLSGD